MAIFLENTELFTITSFMMCWWGLNRFIVFERDFKEIYHTYKIIHV